jgi:hypothetical protein
MRSANLMRSEIRELMKFLDAPGIISFAGGVPDPALFPRQELGAVYAALLGDPQKARIALQYTTSEGYLPLRTWLAQHMRANGVSCDASNILIVNGSQQGLDLVGKLFIDAGDTVILQVPTFPGAMQAFRSYGPKFECLSRAIASPDRVGRAANEGTAKFAYVTADFQNPTGRALSLDERREILTLCERLNIPFLEDNAYAHLRFEGPALPSLTALQLQGRHIDAGCAIYSGTFSKSIAPGLRVAWLAAPSQLIEKLVLIKQGTDLQVSTLNQMAIAEVLPLVFEQVAMASRQHYRLRRDAMLAAMKRHFPAQVAWEKPEGGLFIWATLPEEFDTEYLLDRALKEIKVAFVPGRSFYPGRSVGNTLRLSYSLNTPEVIEAGIARLGGLLEAALRDGSCDGAHVCNPTDPKESA